MDSHPLALYPFIVSSVGCSHREGLHGERCRAQRSSAGEAEHRLQLGKPSPLSLTAAAAHLQETMITAPHPPVSLYQTAVMNSSIHSTIDAVDNASGQLMEASSHAVVARDLFGRD
jgi:hypothetical protein